MWFQSAMNAASKADENGDTRPINGNMEVLLVRQAKYSILKIHMLYHIVMQQADFAVQIHFSVNH